MAKKNELEVLFKVLEKVVKDAMLKSTSQGIKVDDDHKMKWLKIVDATTRLRDYFSVQGAFSLGICKDCTNWSTAGHGNKNFGTCRGGKGGDACNSYYTCNNHTKRRT